MRTPLKVYDIPIGRPEDIEVMDYKYFKSETDLKYYMGILGEYYKRYYGGADPEKMLFWIELGEGSHRITVGRSK